MTTAAQPPSADSAQALMEGLVAAGLRHVCIAPGSRSGPLALAASRNGAMEMSVHLDERGAGFFAVGYAKACGLPAAVICTSGTAAANLLPAAVEARYSATPLVLITADRPPELRDTGAWQTIEQTRLFGPNVVWYAEVPAAAATGPDARRTARNLGARAASTALDRSGPVHLNVPLREPLAGPSEDRSSEKGAGAVRTLRVSRTPTAPAIRALADLIAAAPRGLVVAGPMPPRDGVGDAICALARSAGYPLLADAASNARFPLSGTDAHSRHTTIVAGAEAILRAGWGAARAADLVLRFGASPVWRPVNEYLAGAARIVTVDPYDLWDDPDRRASERVAADYVALASALATALTGLESDPARAAWRAEWQRADEVAAAAAAAAARTEKPSTSAAIDAPDRRSTSGADDAPGRPSTSGADDARGRRSTSGADEVPAVTPGDDDAAGVVAGPRTSLWVVPALLAALSDGAQVWAANSMSVRELDSFGRSELRVRVLTNRGAAGIDGTVSAALGAARATLKPTVLMTGDLALLHDLNGLLAADEAHAPVVIVVLNDEGGGIFSYLDSVAEPEFERLFRTRQVAHLGAVSEAMSARHVWAGDADALAEALKAGLCAAGATVVEVPLDFEANAAAHRAYWADVKARLGSGVGAEA